MHRRNETKKLKNSLNLIKGRTGCAFVTIFILNKHGCDESTLKTNYKLPSHLAPPHDIYNILSLKMCEYAYDEVKILSAKFLISLKFR